MKPVYQTILLGDGPEPDKRGNCYSACLASILELPLGVVPHFAAKFDEPDAWWADLQAFIEPFGLRILWLDPSEHELGGWLPSGYWIATVDGGRGWEHAVVMQDDQLAHDPFPFSRRSAVGREEITLIEYFVTVDPAIAVRGARLALAPPPMPPSVDLSGRPIIGASVDRMSTDQLRSHGWNV